MDYDLLDSDVDVVMPPTAMVTEVSSSSQAVVDAAQPDEPPEPEREPAVAASAAAAPVVAVAPAVSIPGAMLTPQGAAAIADIDTLELAALLSPSKLTEYLTKTVGEHQAVIDVDAAPGMAIKAMMRQALLLVLANQKIVAKTDSRATQLENVMTGSLARQETMVKTFEPALRAGLKSVLEDADELIIDLIKGHLSAGIDAQEVMAQRKLTEELRGRLATAEAVPVILREQMVRDEEAHGRELDRVSMESEDRADLARRAARKFTWMACAFSAVIGGLVVAAAGHLLH